MNSKSVEIELGGAKRFLALDLNATIALYTLTGQDLTAVIAKVTEGGHDIEKLKAIRLITWALLASDCPEFENDPKSLKLVGSWISFDTVGKISTAIGKLLETMSRSNEFDGQLAPYVPSPAAVVRKMVEFAELSDGQLAADLGAGDGRLMFAAAEAANVTVVGLERHPDRLNALKARCAQHVNGSRVSVLDVDIKEWGLQQQDAVFLYLLTSSNAELKAKILAEMKPGARLISHDFGMPDWTPDRTEKVQCEDRAHTVHCWIIPAK